MRILVTGTSGFSGKIIARNLAEQDHEIVAMTRPGRHDPYKACYLNRLVTYQADLLSGDSIPRGLDAIVHAAALSPAPGVSIADLVSSNVDLTSRLVDEANKNNIRKFIYLSTVSIYGEISEKLVDQNTSIHNPCSYGLTKLLGERVIADSYEHINSIAIRLPGIIGPGSVRNWLTQVRDNARSGKSITIYNPESPFNNAIHIQDLCNFIGVLLSRDWVGFDAVTVGALNSLPINKVVEIIVNCNENKSKTYVEKSKKESYLISNDHAISYGYQPTDISEMIKAFATEI